jgi:hypothetical protein
LVKEPKVPVPPTELPVKMTEALLGKPDGFKFPKASLVVRVITKFSSEITSGADEVTKPVEVE